MFTLHPQLQTDTFVLGELPLSLVLLMNNAAVPWLILVPQRNAIREWHELEKCDQVQLHNESMLTSSILVQAFNGDKLNIGALGNMVPQLHVHHIIRFESDPAWPQPVWGNLAEQPYTKDTAPLEIEKLRSAFLKTDLKFKPAPSQTESIRL